MKIKTEHKLSNQDFLGRSATFRTSEPARAYSRNKLARQQSEIFKPIEKIKRQGYEHAQEHYPCNSNGFEIGLLSDFR